MNRSIRPIQYVVWSGLLLIIFVIVAAFVAERHHPKQEEQQEGTRLPVYGQVQPFSLTNQLEKVISLDSLKGKVWMANIIFSRCPGPCAQMSAEMSALQSAVPADWPVQFVSLTTDPGFDTPEVLEKYGERFKADDSRWWFLTGPKKDIAKVALNSLKLTTLDKEEKDREVPEDLFIHSTISVLIDKKGQLRGSFQVLSPDPDVTEEQAALYRKQSLEQMRKAIEQLLKEKAD